MIKSIKDIDWKKWSPKIRATLLFIFKENEILLIHKKTGLGKGKINAPGGKIEEGESPDECAIRETFEEVCVQPSDVKKAGELFFQFLDGLTIHGYVFYTDQYLGTPAETREANPFGVLLMKFLMIRCGKMISLGYPVYYQKIIFMVIIFLMMKND